MNFSEYVLQPEERLVPEPLCFSYQKGTGSQRKSQANFVKLFW